MAEESQNHISSLQCPPDIIVQILKELPVASLLRFKCVSKIWCSIIDDPYFVELHRKRSHHRANYNITLLVRTKKEAPHEENHMLSMVDLEGKPLPLPNPKPRIASLVYGLHSVEGLVYLDNMIWNPSTRKKSTLPPQCHLVSPEGFDHVSLSYVKVLGYDGFSKKHKVLSFCYISRANNNDQSYYVEWNSEGNQALVTLQILTLGTYEWRHINLSAEIHHCLLQMKRDEYYHRIYITNILYFLNNSSQSLMAFEFRHEKFRLMPFPDDACYDSLNPYFAIFEMGGRLALVSVSFSTIWILEDFESARWTKANLTWPESWGVKGYDSYGDFLQVSLVTSIRTGEILMKSRTKYSRKSSRINGFFYFCYDVESQSIRKIPKLTDKLLEDIYCQHVDTLLPP